MKKRVLITFVLAMLMMSALCAAHADDFDLSYVRNSDSYTIDVNQEDGVAFIETSLETGSLAFHHKYESDFYYSSTRWDMLVLDYFKSKPYPVLRLWIRYSADKYINATAVSIDLDGKRYTFSSVGDPDLNTKKENGIIENLLIKFGAENSDFISAMIDYISKHHEALFDESRRWSEIKIPVKIYGSETVETEFDAGFVTDALAILMAMSECNGIQYMGKANDTPMKVSTITN